VPPGTRADRGAGNERVRSTVLAIADDLTKDGMVLRYRVEGTNTGFEGEEGTFTICSFWLVTALAMIGETERARAPCRMVLAGRMAPGTGLAHPRGGRRPVPALGEHAGQALMSRRLGRPPGDGL